MNTYSIVLSAGRGTRMKSEKPKVLQEILGKSMLEIVVEQLSDLDIKNNYVVVGYEKEMVINHMDNKFDNVYFAEQDQQLGTGHAVKILKNVMKDLEGTTIITCGDTPLVTKEIFANLLKYHTNNSQDLTILSTEIDNPFGYGRIIRDDNFEVMKIVEQKDATTEEEKVCEINSGIYCINNQKLFEYITKIDNDNNQKEYYLTDIISIFKEAGLKVGAYKTKESDNLLGVNDLLSLAKATSIMKERINSRHLLNGVNILDPNNTYIGLDVQIGEGTIIYPNNYIIGKVKIGQNNILKPSNYIENSIIGNNNEIGPMAHIRQESDIKDNIRIGNFVEIKKSKLAKGVKSAHLTYIGDTVIGESTNIGCGVITANYDGKNKFRTEIGSNSFIGSNVNLIAPVKISDDTFVAAGTTVTEDIPKNKFVIGRTRAVIKDKK